MYEECSCGKIGMFIFLVDKEVFIVYVRYFFLMCVNNILVDNYALMIIFVV